MDHELGHRVLAPIVVIRCTAALLATLVGGCNASISAGAPFPPGAAQSARAAGLNGTRGYLYLGNSFGSGSTLVVYPLNGTKPLREIAQSWNVYAMAVDRWGDVYIANNNPSYGEITAYTSGGRSALLTIFTGAVDAMAFNSAGDLYAADSGYVFEYAPRSKKRLRPARDAENVNALAVDRAGNIYAAQLSGNCSCILKGAIKVFAPGASHAFRTIRRGINTPVALVFDGAGNLYVANCPSCYAGKDTGSVAEYAPGSAVPSRVLKNGINDPVALAVGNDGRLFVSNHPGFSTGDKTPGWIAVYSSSGKSPVRRITRGIEWVGALAVDAEGHLYSVGGGGDKSDHDEIAVYSPDGSRRIRTITDGVAAPRSIAVGE
jgi:hypothetical protein